MEAYAFAKQTQCVRTALEAILVAETPEGATSALEYVKKYKLSKDKDAGTGLPKSVDDALHALSNASA